MARTTDEVTARLARLSEALAAPAGRVLRAAHGLAAALDHASPGDTLRLSLNRGGVDLSREAVVRVGTLAVEAA
jgi:hypothetical protein